MEIFEYSIASKTTKIVYIGNVFDKDAWDTIIAPGSEFTTLWNVGHSLFMRNKIFN